GRHRRAIDRGRRSDVAEHAWTAAARSAASGAAWPDQPAVAQHPRRLHGDSVRYARPVARQQLTSAYRSRRWGGGRARWRALDRGLQARRWNAHVSGLRAGLAQLPWVGWQRGVVALSDHARGGRQRCWLGTRAAIPTLGWTRTAFGDG